MRKFKEHVAHVTGDELVNASLNGDVEILMKLDDVRSWIKRLPVNALSRLVYSPGEEGKQMPLLLRAVNKWIDHTKTLVFFVLLFTFFPKFSGIPFFLFDFSEPDSFFLPMCIFFFLQD